MCVRRAIDTAASPAFRYFVLLAIHRHLLPRNQTYFCQFLRREVPHIDGCARLPLMLLCTEDGRCMPERLCINCRMTLS